MKNSVLLKNLHLAREIGELAVEPIRNVGRTLNVFSVVDVVFIRPVSSITLGCREDAVPVVRVVCAKEASNFREVLIHILMCVTNRQEGDVYLLEHAPLHQASQVPNHVLVFVLLGGVIHLQEQDTGQGRVCTHDMQKNSMQALDDNVGPVLHVVQVSEGIGSPPMHQNTHEIDGQLVRTKSPCLFR